MMDRENAIHLMWLSLMATVRRAGGEVRVDQGEVLAMRYRDDLSFEEDASGGIIVRIVNPLDALAGDG